MKSFGEIIGSIVGVDGHINKIENGYAVLLTGFLVIIGWYINSRSSDKSHRNENCHKYIVTNIPGYMKDVAYLTKYINEGIPFPEYNKVNAITHRKIFQALFRTLTQLEIMAIDLKHGLVSESYLRDTQRTFVTRMYDQSRAFIDTARKEFGQPSAYKNFEIMYIRLRYKERTSIQILLEFILNRPMFALSYNSLALKYFLYNIFNSKKLGITESDERSVRKAMKFWYCVEILFYTILISYALLHDFPIKPYLFKLLNCEPSNDGLDNNPSAVYTCFT